MRSISLKESKATYWSSCPDCQGRGKKSRRLRKAVRRAYQRALSDFEKSERVGTPPVHPKADQYSCETCAGKGILPADGFPEPDRENYPHVAIIGAGIGGTALAIACLHRGIPFTIYERDISFNDRSQGYGLTLQQASQAIASLGITSLEKGLVSTRHVVHQTDGTIIAEWGMRKWLGLKEKTSSKQTNMHIARQNLREAMLDQLGSEEVKWGYRLLEFKKGEEFELTFKSGTEEVHCKADLIVGADGIRSTVRRLTMGEELAPLNYLGCLVILGICRLDALKDKGNELLDSTTVFQTANGNERIYVMPFDKESVMWQLSFPMEEEQAKELSAKGPQTLKEEAISRTQWHDPIPDIMQSSDVSLISGYPVYDRELLKPEWFRGDITLIGDAAHPMSPFKGQGANQAILDALSLVREITKSSNKFSQWREKGLRETVLSNYEEEMIHRSAVKVKGSAEAAKFLHSEYALHKGDEPRGRHLREP